MSRLIPTVTVDKNGRTTTVYKREDSPRREISNLFGMLPRTPEPSRAELVAAIEDEIKQLMTYEFTSPYRKITSKALTSNLQGILHVLSSETASDETLSVLSEYAEQANSKKDYNTWVQAFATHYDEMQQWRCGGGGRLSDGMAAKFVAEVLYSESELTSLGRDGEMEMVRLSFALYATGIPSDFTHHPTPYGYAFFSSNKYLREFVTEHHENRELMDTAAALLSGKKINRIEDLADIASGDLPTAFAEGAL